MDTSGDIPFAGPSVLTGAFADGSVQATTLAKRPLPRSTTGSGSRVATTSLVDDTLPRPLASFVVM